MVPVVWSFDVSVVFKFLFCFVCVERSGRILGNFYPSITTFFRSTWSHLLLYWLIVFRVRVSIDRIECERMEKLSNFGYTIWVTSCRLERPAPAHQLRFYFFLLLSLSLSHSELMKSISLRPIWIDAYRSHRKMSIIKQAQENVRVDLTRRSDAPFY